MASQTPWEEELAKRIGHRNALEHFAWYQAPASCNFVAGAHTRVDFSELVEDADGLVSNPAAGFWEYEAPETTRYLIRCGVLFAQEAYDTDPLSFLDLILYLNGAYGTRFQRKEMFSGTQILDGGGWARQPQLAGDLVVNLTIGDQIHARVFNTGTVDKVIWPVASLFNSQIIVHKY